MSRSKTLADLSGAVALLYVSVWLYEAGNYLVLSLSGAQATLVLNGILPVGVVGVGGSALPGVAKLLQVGVAMGVLVPVYAVLRRSFSITLLALVTIMATFLTSFYWELLSLVGPLPLALHEALFTLLSAGALVLFTRSDPSLRGMVW